GGHGPSCCDIRYTPPNAFGWRSPEVTQLWPEFFERRAHVAAKPDGLSGLLRHAVRIVDMADRLDRAAHRDEPLALAPVHQHDAAVRAARAPQIIILVAADRGGQGPGRAEDVGRRGVPKVPGEDRGAGPVLGRQGLIGLAERFGDVGPAVLVCVILRQFAELEPFAGAWPEAER